MKLKKMSVCLAASALGLSGFLMTAQAGSNKFYVNKNSSANLKVLYYGQHNPFLNNSSPKDFYTKIYGGSVKCMGYKKDVNSLPEFKKIFDNIDSKARLTCHFKNVHMKRVSDRHMIDIHSFHGSGHGKIDGKTVGRSGGSKDRVMTGLKSTGASTFTGKQTFVFNKSGRLERILSKNSITKNIEYKTTIKKVVVKSSHRTIDY